MPPRKAKPGMTPEAREQQLTNLAVDLAEKQLREGTASPSIINHYLKLASRRETIERDILEKQATLLTAKTESLEASKASAASYTDAIAAMTRYGVQRED